MAAGIGAAYLAAARLALLLALPPGYATAVWPAAGLALAAVLLWGPRVWPGIAAGSFLANAWTALANADDASLLTTLAVPLAIATGATLQAVVGAALIRRLGGDDASGTRRSPLRLALVGGPLSCLTSATLGVGALLAADLLAPSNAAFSWFTWWAGDSIGVVVFTPLCLVWADRRLAWRRKVSISLPVAITFVLVVVLYVAASSWGQRRLERAAQGSTVAIVDEAGATPPMSFHGHDADTTAPSGATAPRSLQAWTLLVAGCCSPACWGSSCSRPRND